MAEQPNLAQDQPQETPSLQKIQDLLRAKDDTSKFVGLALLKSVLDNSPDLRQDEETLLALWTSIPAKFLDRLLRAGSGENASSSKDSNDMMDLAVSVLHTFAVLLPDHTKGNSKFCARIPRLVACLTYTSGTTEELLLQTLLSLVSHTEGAVVLNGVEDLSPLIEIAPSQPLVLDILSFAWLQGQSAATSAEEKQRLMSKIDKTIDALVISFKGTDAVTLLAFLADLLRRLDPEIIPPNPNWLPEITSLIHKLVTSRPTQTGRAAYTNLAATLLQIYPVQSPCLLFSSQTPSSSKASSSQLLISLLQIDVRSSIPTLLSNLNSPSYPSLSKRLTSAFDVLSHFISYLLRTLDADDPNAMVMSSSDLLSLRKSLSETMADTISYLRDRYDAATAGAMGLHPSARTGTAEERMALAWDSKVVPIQRDELVLGAVRTLALWVREDEGDVLRREAAGLADLLMELYVDSGKGEGGNLEFRDAVLVALQGICACEEGVEAVLEHGGWEVLSSDLLAILEGEDEDDGRVRRGIEIVRVLLMVVEAAAMVREEWMDVVTRVAAWELPEGRNGWVVEFWVAVLQLVADLVVNAPPGLTKRYGHSVSSVLRTARRLEEGLEDDELRTEVQDVVDTLHDASTGMVMMRR